MNKYWPTIFYSFIFVAKIEVVKCPKDPREWKQTFEIYPVGINEKVLVNLEMMCQCDCEKPGNPVSNQLLDYNLKVPSFFVKMKNRIFTPFFVLKLGIHWKCPTVLEPWNLQMWDLRMCSWLFWSQMWMWCRKFKFSWRSWSRLQTR